MKKFLQEFKEFAMRGNVVDMAVGVIIGAAFGKVVTAVIDIFLTPILEALPKLENGGTGFAGSLISFLAVLVEFILTALVLFIIIKAMNKAKNLKKKPAEKPAAPTTKVCPFCQSEISIKATRCPHCTSELEYKPGK
ncbi:MAG: large conductance mechanosensitive channel protein MscL [Clostridia bacterium]|nr:large conductance mechanosensitive channel protein MscL [Clostridia bacterium]